MKFVDTRGGCPINNKLLVRYRSSHQQHIQKALMQMNLQLQHVVKDITGLKARRIIDAILSGERDTENEHGYFWADSAYSGECFEDLLSLGGFESMIHEKGARNKPFAEASKELNRIKSAIRACVEHVFGRLTISMGGKATRKIGLARTEAWWGLINLMYNFFLRYLQRTSRLAAVASH